MPVAHNCLDLGSNCTYRDFLKTDPPIFLKAKEPLEAKNWVRTIEKKFSLICCSEVQKTMFIVQQLQGSVGAWWASFIATQPEGHQALWSDLCTTFLAHFIPNGIREVKIEQFLQLQQGERSVLEYLDQFNQLAQYAFEYVITELEKKCYFLRGLNTKIKIRMVGHFSRSCDEFVSIAIKADESNHVHQEDKKRRRMLTESTDSNVLGPQMIVRAVHHLPCSSSQSLVPQPSKVRSEVSRTCTE